MPRSGIANLQELLFMTFHELKKTHSYDRFELNNGTTATVYDKIRTYKIVNGQEVENTPTREVFDVVMNTVVMRLIRERRDMKLERTDRYSLPDYPHASEEKRQEWLAYRQTLRDFTNNFTFEVPEHGCIDESDITWPEEPTS